MGKTFNSGKTVAKLATFVIGAVPATVRGIDMGVEKVVPEFHKELKSSSWGSLALGDSKAHDFALNATVDFFGSSNEVTLSKDEIDHITKGAQEVADQTGIDVSVLLPGLLETARAAKAASK